MYTHKTKHYRRPHKSICPAINIERSLKYLIHSTCVNFYLSTNLISALANLDLYDFPHFSAPSSTNFDSDCCN
jgi:hypothetical protein